MRLGGAPFFTIVKRRFRASEISFCLSLSCCWCQSDNELQSFVRKPVTEMLCGEPPGGGPQLIRYCGRADAIRQGKYKWVSSGWESPDRDCRTWPQLQPPGGSLSIFYWSPSLQHFTGSPIESPMNVRHFKFAFKVPSCISKELLSQRRNPSIHLLLSKTLKLEFSR